MTSIRRTALEPLVKRRGSPRPAGRDALSLKIFPSTQPATWNAKRWGEWFADHSHSAEGVVETLVNRGCPQDELHSILLRLYVVPVAGPLTRADLARLHKTITAARKALEQLEGSTFDWLGELSPISEDARLELTGVEMRLASLHGGLRRSKADRVPETLACAWLFALIRVHTRNRKWLDREVADLLSVLWGRVYKNGAAALEEWRRRNEAIVDLHLQLYKLGVRWDAPQGPERPYDPDEPSDLEDPDG